MNCPSRSIKTGAFTYENHIIGPELLERLPDGDGNVSPNADQHQPRPNERKHGQYRNGEDRAVALMCRERMLLQVSLYSRTMTISLE